MAYKVTKEDLKGYLKDFPIEVVEKMLEYQVQQGNPEDITVFQDNKTWNKGIGGFEWADTDVREDRSGRINFWSSVINHKNWGTFFNRFPKYPPKVGKKVEEERPDIDFMTDGPYIPPVEGVNVDIESEDTTIDNPFAELEFTNVDTLPAVGELIIVSNAESFSNIQRVFICYTEQSPYPVITVTKDVWDRLIKGDIKNSLRVCPYKFFKKIAKEEIVELTLEDISAGKGVGVPSHLIKIVNKK